MLVPRIAVTKMKSEIDVRRDRVSEIDDPSEQSLLRPIDESFELPACQEQNFMGNVPLNCEVLMGDQLRNFIDFLLQCGGVRLLTSACDSGTINPDNTATAVGSET